MRANTLLPLDYDLLSRIDFPYKKITGIGLPVASFFLFFASGWLFKLLAAALNPAFINIESLTMTPLLLVIALVLLALTLLLVVVLHEIIHGLFFWLFTHDRPAFGFRGPYACACSPHWYIPRNQFLLVSLSPLVLLTFVGCLLFPLTPSPISILLVTALALNVAGSVRDLFLVGWMLTKPSASFIHDAGNGIHLYRPCANDRRIRA